MVRVEMMPGILGDVFLNVERRQGVGFNACAVDSLQISGTTIAIGFRAEQPSTQLSTGRVFARSFRWNRS